jgi:signal transduction histidine kinase
VSENTLTSPGGAEAERAEILSGQFFLECNLEGVILWMSDAARARLGEWTHLLQGTDKEQDSGIMQYLRTCRAGDVIRVLRDTRAHRGVPVWLACFMRGSQRVILSLQVRERAADHAERTMEGLGSLQSRMLDHYFKLLRLQQALDSRSERGRRHSGAGWIEQLERERARIGRELHTGAGQAYSAIRYQLEWIARKAPELPEEIRACLERIGKAARDADAEVRAVSRWLHPPDWQALRLTEALRNLWHSSGIPETFQATLTLGELTPEPPHPVRVTIYRIVQEGLSNAIRHSGATQLALTVEQSNGEIHLRLHDNGHGFDMQRPADAKTIGLRSMQEQARALGGAVNIQSGAGGTTLEVRIPLGSGNE